MPLKITNDDIFSAVEKMELADFLKLINHYSEKEANGIQDRNDHRPCYASPNG